MRCCGTLAGTAEGTGRAQRTSTRARLAGDSAAITDLVWISCLHLSACPTRGGVGEGRCIAFRTKRWEHAGQTAASWGAAVLAMGKGACAAGMLWNNEFGACAYISTKRPVCAQRLRFHLLYGVPKGMGLPSAVAAATTPSRWRAQSGMGKWSGRCWARRALRAAARTGGGSGGCFDVGWFWGEICFTHRSWQSWCCGGRPGSTVQHQGPVDRCKGVMRC